jgi:tRNA pseudouridine38-40 synthase
LPHFKLTLSYDGSAFVGWQRQASGVSIQGLLEGALAEFDGRPVAAVGAGRTDAGVHALGQVASFSLARDTDAATVVRAVNARLPPAVRVVDAVEVAPGFHARFAATSKVYRYRIWNAEVLSPFEQPYVWHLPTPRLDIEAMMAAAGRFEGKHDFSAFQGAGAEMYTAERTIYFSRVIRGEAASAGSGWNGASQGSAGALVLYEVSGDGFLRHMVRNIAGTLVEVGRGRRAAESMTEVIASRSRARAGETAPASGLFLVGVSYEGPDL